MLNTKTTQEVGIVLKSKLNIVSVNIVAGCLIGLCVLILSYTHTTALFDRAGYDGIFAHIGVIGFEMTFILGTVTVIWSKWVGEKVGSSSRFVFSLGVIVNLYSNITSGIAQNGEPLVFWVINKNWQINEAVLIGALIPLLIVAAEMVVQDAIFKYRASKEQTNKPDDRVAEFFHAQRNTITQDGNEYHSFKESIPSNTLREDSTEWNQESIQELHNPSSISNTMDRVSLTSRQVNRDVTSESIISLANQMKQTEGKFPSVRRLAEEANITMYRAKKVLEQLKKEAG